MSMSNKEILSIINARIDRMSVLEIKELLGYNQGNIPTISIKRKRDYRIKKKINSNKYYHKEKIFIPMFFNYTKEKQERTLRDVLSDLRDKDRMISIYKDRLSGADISLSV